MAQKQALGKGLASLFPGMNGGMPPQAHLSTTSTAGAVAAGPATTVQQQEVVRGDRQHGLGIANVDDIQVNQFQPRREFEQTALEELAQSIRSNGIIQPLIVRKTAMGAYELIAGERRLRAAKIAGLKQVPIVVRKSTDRESLELALIENIQRENLNCVDEALAYYQLVQDFSLTQEEVAARVGKDRATVANTMRLLRLPEAIIMDLKRQVLSYGHGKALLGLEDNELRIRARNEIVGKKLSVRAAEALVDQMKTTQAMSPKAAAKAMTTVQQRLGSISTDLTRKWSTKVALAGSERRGKIIFHYGSRQELDRLLEALQNHKI